MPGCAGRRVLRVVTDHLSPYVPAGLITTVADTGTQADSGANGPATSAQLSYPHGVDAISTSSTVYVSDKPKSGSWTSAEGRLKGQRAAMPASNAGI